MDEIRDKEKETCLLDRSVVIHPYRMYLQSPGSRAAKESFQVGGVEGFHQPATLIQELCLALIRKGSE
jgi:hypothetical protein